jgi:dimethylhistidine N-methyltransferase
VSLLAPKSANLASPDGLLAADCEEILGGLTAPQKRIAPKYFYDERGSALFDEICRLPEYYPTRTEARIMQARLGEIAARVGPRASVIEFGAGSNAKARTLLGALAHPAAYVPVEISGEYATEQAAELEREFPDLEVVPVIADFTRPFELPPQATGAARRLVFFPGSTIGNFERDQAQSLLEVMRQVAGSRGALLIGVDLIKDHDTVIRAYNDSQGVTAEFNRNVLHHLNAGIGSNFRPELFRHEAVYDADRQRIEMRLIALLDHSVAVAGRRIDFKRGEHIVTEYSHKYTVESFVRLAAAAGWQSTAVWTDAQALFSVHYLVPRLGPTD